MTSPANVATAVGTPLIEHVAFVLVADVLVDETAGVVLEARGVCMSQLDTLI